MYCKKCGSEIKEGEKFCPQCGTPVGPAPTQPQPDQPEPEGKGATNRNLIIGIAAAIVILVILIAVIASLHTSSRQAAEEPVTEIPEVTDGGDDGSDATNGGLVEEDPESHIQISGVQVSVDPYATSLYNAVYGFAENRSHLTATVSNDNDVACELQFSFEYQYKYTDSYGDTQTQTEMDEWTYYAAAHESRQISAWLSWSSDEETAYAFTGNYELNVWARDTGTGDGDTILPLNAVTQTEVTGTGTHDGHSRDNIDAVVDGEYENRLNVIFTVPNETGENWWECTVEYDWYYDGIYLGTGDSYGTTYYVKPGEDAVVISDGTYYIQDFAHVLDVPNSEIAPKITVDVTGVRYQPDTDRE